jgi:Asp-tRNA(Asn)/Glu-tRNA(Gln) amidotransferase A subunit family amidase
MQLVGAPNHDPTLLAVAEWCEAVLDVQLDPGR